MASLTAALNRLANRLAREPKQAQPARTGRNTGPTVATRPVPAPVEAAPPAAAAPAPTASACAVIGCKRPLRSQGYCAAHYQKRRLMMATGRLHAAWVEDAAPHSIPEVILPRGRRPKADAAPPAPKPPVSATPRMWVRKKGAAGADGTSGQGTPTPAGQPPLASERERATATAQRWANEFRSRTRRA
ncbi:cell wall protein [Myxococcus virescens]|uniref:cell wall protein n=1 Tax=Myxococcus virescens TaxID=83456 RepID=UPI001FC971CB|nr:cell wall protein [Myxococcus virescens]